MVAGVREDGYQEILGAESRSVKMWSSGRDCSRNSKNEGPSGFNWSSPIATRHPEGGFSRLPRRILVDVSGLLQPGRLEVYSRKYQKEVVKGLKEAYGSEQRLQVVGVFLNEESLIRLVGSVQMDINEEWVIGRRYLTMEKE